METIEGEGQVGVTTLLNAAVSKLEVRRAATHAYPPFRIWKTVSPSLLWCPLDPSANHFGEQNVSKWTAVYETW